MLFHTGTTTRALAPRRQLTLRIFGCRLGQPEPAIRHRTNADAVDFQAYVVVLTKLAAIRYCWISYHALTASLFGWSTPKRKLGTQTLINFFALRPTFTFMGVVNRLVHLFIEHIFPNLHCRVWILPGIGAARDKLGSVGAKFYSPDPRISCGTRARSVTSEGGRHYHFDLPCLERSLMTLFDIAAVAYFLPMACARLPPRPNLLRGIGGPLQLRHRLSGNSHSLSPGAQISSSRDS